MDFLWSPSLLLLLSLPILIAAYLWMQRRKRPSAVRYSSLSLVREALPRSSRIKRHLPFALFVVAIGALVLALARPVLVLSVPANQTTILLALDVSGSMCSTDIPPNRLVAAEGAATLFIRGQGSATEIGIVAFGGFAEVVQAPTSDQNALLKALQSLTTGRRTAIGSGLLASIDAIAEVDGAVQPSTGQGKLGVEPAAPPKGDYVPDIIVLLTDGVSNAGPEPIDAAKQAADRGIRVYTIGFGSADGGELSADCAPQFIGGEPGAGFGNGGGFGGGAPGGFRRGIDEDTLKQVADMTGGQYYPAESAEQLESVFAGLPMSLITKHEVVEVSVALVALGGLLAALGVLLGRAWRPLP